MVMFILETMKVEEGRDRGNAFLPMEVSVEGVRLPYSDLKVISHINGITFFPLLKTQN